VLEGGGVVREDGLLVGVEGGGGGESFGVGVAGLLGVDGAGGCIVCVQSVRIDVLDCAVTEAGQLRAHREEEQEGGQPQLRKKEKQRAAQWVMIRSGSGGEERTEAGSKVTIVRPSSGQVADGCETVTVVAQRVQEVGWIGNSV